MLQKEKKKRNLKKRGCIVTENPAVTRFKAYYFELVLRDSALVGFPDKRRNLGHYMESVPTERPQKQLAG